ncbi:MAG TPA: protein-methionine-sulfoxide reductase catalytic subunit MsrP [Rhodospirillales bacterium]|nr:protein-methionine-sulfoxide reductase catalytic subunit MsrP [Rhodospirillales bacterium]
MLLRVRRGWEIPESEVTPEPVYWNRRRLLRAMGIAPALLAARAAAMSVRRAEPAVMESDIAADRYPAPRNPRYTLDRPLTDPELATTYNNFYEFGSYKQIWKAAQDLRLRPWTVTIDGMVERERVLDAEDLIRQMPLEERLYRHRCVEAWSMAVPWTGFPLRALVELARPLSGARYLRMETFLDPDMAPGQRASWYPWPYVEGLTLAEAVHELAFIATGIYGKPLPPQNGAPLRLVVPWKYGFKSIKSIVRFTFTDRRPETFWSVIGPDEYGFWANVNPEVPHPRWSQRDERPLGSSERVPTLLFNGYAEFVAGLYEGLADEPLFM